MELLKTYKSIDLNFIQDLVLNQEEEGLYFEFKTVNFPDINGQIFDRKNLSKCLSGFSNSDGGIIIWGIDAKQNSNKVDAASDLKPIKELSRFSNWVKKNEGISITPAAAGVIHKNIEINPGEGFLVTLVPASKNAPHIANFADKHYYKRSADNFYLCEHYDLMDIINRKSSPELSVKIDLPTINISLIRADYTEFKLITFFKIVNSGKVLANYIKLEINVNKPFSIGLHGIDGNGNTGLPRSASKNYSKTYYGGNNIAIHAESELIIDSIRHEKITKIDDLIDLDLNYRVIADGMKAKSGSLNIKKEKLKELFAKVKTG